MKLDVISVYGDTPKIYFDIKLMKLKIKIYVI